MITHGFIPKKPGISANYERNGVFSIADVHAKVPQVSAVQDRVERDFDGDLISTNSLRYYVFRRSLMCVGCGLMGMIYCKERQASASKNAAGYKVACKRFHFNLYDRTGEVLFTKSRIDRNVPDFSDLLKCSENYETMCSICQSKKPQIPVYKSRDKG